MLHVKYVRAYGGRAAGESLSRADSGGAQEGIAVVENRARRMCPKSIERFLALYLRSRGTCMHATYPSGRVGGCRSKRPGREEGKRVVVKFKSSSVIGSGTLQITLDCKTCHWPRKQTGRYMAGFAIKLRLVKFRSALSGENGRMEIPLRNHILTTAPLAHQAGATL